MRVGVDVSPLRQTGAGTARHVNGLLGALAGRDEIDVKRLAFGGPGRLASVARDTAWYFAGLPLAARSLDVLHCTTFRGPLRSPVPFTVTIHDLALVRHPELFPRWHRTSGRLAIGPVARAAARVLVVSEFTKRETVELLGVPEERVRVIGNAVDAVFTPDGPAAEGEYVLAVGTLEPRKNLRRVEEAARIAGLELRVVGAQGWGGVSRASSLGSVATPSSPASTAAPSALSSPRSTKASGFRCSRRWPAARRSSRPATARRPRSPRRCGARRPARRGGDRGRTARGDRTPRRAARARARARPFLHLGRRRGRHGRRLEGDRVKLVAIDADVLGRRRTGDETYVQNLLRALAPLAPESGLRFAAITRHPELVPAGIEPVKLSTSSQELRMAFTLPRLLRRLGADLGHFQYALPLRLPCPAVVTIHDLSFERDPSLMRRKDRLVFKTMVPRAARRAARVLTVSERTRRDLIEVYELADERIVVTPNGVDPAFTPGPGARDYALLVGAVQERKNPLAALAAAEHAGLPLVVAGPAKDEDLTRELERRGARVTGYVPQEELVELYRGAACLLQTSRYEGFGLPVLEAMACGTPVVAVDEPALREVGGDAAIYAAETGLADAIRQALAERDERSVAGLARARLFSWEATARKTLEVYQEVLR